MVLIRTLCLLIYAAFTHAGLTTRHRTKSLCKTMFGYSRLDNI